MMYSKLETCLIFKNCKNKDEVITAAGAFGYLAINGEEKVPPYAAWHAYIRFKNLVK